MLNQNKSILYKGEQTKIDERDAIFHRFYRLKPGTPEYKEYYKAHPEKLEIDKAIRTLPSLGGPGSKSYNKITSPFQTATFDVIEKITRDVDWEPTTIDGKPVKASKAEFSQRIKEFARYLGADLVGIAILGIKRSIDAPIKFTIAFKYFGSIRSWHRRQQSTAGQRK